MLALPLSRRKHLRFEPYALLAEAFAAARLHKADLDVIDLGPLRTKSMEVPVQIPGITKLSIDLNH